MYALLYNKINVRLVSFSLSLSQLRKKRKNKKCSAPVKTNPKRAVMLQGTKRQNYYLFSSFAAFPYSIPTPRTTIEVIKVYSPSMTESSAKKANLSASRKAKIKLPNCDYARGKHTYHIKEFLSQPAGIETVLNTKALQSFQFIDANTYRCTLPTVRFLNFEAAPVLDLQVTSTDEDCLVELLSCKFEGSKAVEHQSSRFSAFMTNYITWETVDSELFLEVDVKLNLCLEINTQPFLLLPVSAVEGPGNLMMQALLDRLVPLLLQQLRQDYDNWVRA